MLSDALSDKLVLDLSQYLSGPFTSRMLTDLGARVIKVEPPTGRPLMKSPDDILPGFLPPNAGKESIVLNLKSAEGREIVTKLARKADVLLENFRPGVIDRLGLGFEQMQRENPRLIYCSISGFGSNGPLSKKASFDATIQAMSGMMHSTGEADRAPALSSVNIGDLAASSMAATAIVAALLRREKTGVGTRIDMSMLEAAMYLLPVQTQLALQANYTMERYGSSYGPGSVAGAFVSSDGRFVQILCPHFGFQSPFRDALAEVEGYEWLKADERFGDAASMAANSEAFLEIAHKIFAERDADHWMARLDEANVPWGPILTYEEAVVQPQIQARGRAWLDVPGAAKPVPTFPSALHLAGGETPPVLHVPAFGEHSRSVLKDILGMTDPEVDKLAQDGIVGTSQTNS